MISLYILSCALPKGAQRGFREDYVSKYTFTQTIFVMFSQIRLLKTNDTDNSRHD